jgi:AbrB family looped-hinge helix DNA binding protein
MQQIRTTVTRRWQTVVPAQIRKTLQVKEGDKLVWISDGTSVRVVVLPANPVAALRGIAKGERLYDKLLEARREERARER